MNMQLVWDFVKRHGTIFGLGVMFVLFGGLHAEALAVLKAAALAVIASLALAHVVLWSYTNESFSGEPDAKARIYYAVAILVGLVYMGSYLVEFIN